MQYQGKPLTIPHRDLGVMYALDPSHPKTHEFIREVFSTYRRWGVRYYMLDFLDCMTGATPGTHPNDGYFDKTKINGPEAWREGLRVIRETVTDDTYLLGSTGPAIQVTGLVNGVHLGNDYGDGRPLYGPEQGVLSRHVRHQQPRLVDVAPHGAADHGRVLVHSPQALHCRHGQRDDH